MVKFKSLLGILCILFFGYGAKHLYDFTKDVYSGNLPAKYAAYETQAYFFGWIGYALAVASAFIALYFVYYFISTAWAIFKKSKY